MYSIVPLDCPQLERHETLDMHAVDTLAILRPAETGDEVQNVRAGDRVSIQPNVARFAAFEDRLTKYWSKRGISFKKSLKIILMRGSVQGIV